MSCWKSVFVEYDPKRKIASKKFFNKHGSSLDDISGTLIIKKLIFDLKDKSVSKPLVLTSNISTYYDLEEKSDRLLVEYCPLDVINLEARHEVKVIDLENQEYLKFTHLNKIDFMLMTLEKKKVDIDFKVLIFFFRTPIFVLPISTIQETLAKTAILAEW